MPSIVRPQGRGRVLEAFTAAALSLSLVACGGEEAAHPPPERVEAPVAETPRSPAWDVGVPLYTASQAERGEEVFGAICSLCHLLEDFTGTAFHQDWGGGTVGQLLEFISGAMPRDNPGGLRSDEYAAVLAFILRENAMPPGSEELPEDPAELHRFRMELPSDS